MLMVDNDMAFHFFICKHHTIRNKRCNKKLGEMVHPIEVTLPHIMFSSRLSLPRPFEWPRVQRIGALDLDLSTMRQSQQPPYLMPTRFLIHQASDSIEGEMSVPIHLTLERLYVGGVPATALGMGWLAAVMVFIGWFALRPALDAMIPQAGSQMHGKGGKDQ